jgi:selenocysteine lyase/cysteine desulfurase
MNHDRFPAVMAAAAHGGILADNAAGAQLPDSALERLQRYVTYDNAQKGGIFKRTQATTDLVDEAKAEFAALIDAPAAHVGVGANATSIAMALSRLVSSTIVRGDRIVVTAADHEANVAPWMWLRRFGAQVDVAAVGLECDGHRLRRGAPGAHGAEREIARGRRRRSGVSAFSADDRPRDRFRVLLGV